MKNKKILEWKLYSKLPEYKRQIKSAITIINRAKSLNKKFMICWSGGKDSTVMTHLVKSIWHDCPITVQFDDCDWPEKKDYIDRICNKFKWKINKAIPDFSIWEYAKINRIGYVNFCSKDNKLTKEGFLKPLNDMRKKLGCDGSFIGLRKEESNRRKRGQKYNGNIYTLKTGEIICTPVIHMNVKTIFAYHVVNDIEINPCYFHNAFDDPEEIRLSWFLPTIYRYSKGEPEYMKKYYPELYNRFRNMNIFT